VIVITAPEIAAQGAQNVSEVLRTVPGLDVVQTGAVGGQTSVLTRGGDANFTLVLIDGVVVNQSGGDFDFANLTVDNIDRIEVIRGPASTLYGSGAVSGVIHIITKRGQGRPTGDVSFEGGSFNTRIWRGNATGGVMWGGLAVSASRTDTDGHLAFNNQYENSAVALRGDAYPDKQTDIKFTLRYNDSEFHFPTDEAGRVLFHNQFQTSRETTLGLQGERLILPWWRTRLLFGYHDIKTRVHSEFGTPPDTTLSLFVLHEVRTSVDWQSDFTLTPVGQLTVGLDYKKDEDRTDDVQRTTTSGFLQQQFTVFKPLIVIAGFRVDGSSTFGTHVTYQTSAAYRFPTQTKLRAAVGTGFKEPTFFQNFSTVPFAHGNPNLKPERSFSWEVGLDQELWQERVRLGVTYFQNRYKDLIDFAAPSDPNAPSFFNIEVAKASGVELTAVVTPLPAWSAGVSYTYLHTEVTDAGGNTNPSAALVQGRALLRRPEHKVHVFADYTHQRFHARLDLNYVGSRADRDFRVSPAVRVTNPAYTKLDLLLRYTLVKDWGWVRALDIFARGENLLDQHYSEAFGFSAPGIAGYGGIKLTL
jgi:vitamin B12 transporter